MRQSDTWVSKANLLAASLLALISSTGVHAQSFAPRYFFGTNPGDPMWFREYGVLSEGPDRAIYSTSPAGGKYAQGTIFKITTDGALQVLHDFDGKTGSTPQGGLTCAKGIDGKCNGTFYGTTYSGGRYGPGTIFRTSGKVGAPETLYNFRAGNMTDIPRRLCPPSPCPYTTRERLDAAAGFPFTAPVQGNDGNFYGVSSYSGNYRYGVLYKISPAGGFQALCINGELPSDPRTTDAELIKQCMFDGAKGNFPISLTAGSDGNLYGTCLGGLPNNPYGTIFKSTLDGKVSLLHKFDLVGGSYPYSVMQASDGDLYGTASAGGEVGAGVVFRLNPSMSTTAPLIASLGMPFSLNLSLPNLSPFKVLTSFRNLKPGESGFAPMSGLVEGPDGNLYGTTKLGGKNNRGVLFKISKSGENFGVVHNFDGAGGANPLATPILHSDGSFYGTTYVGGKGGGVLYNDCFEPKQEDMPCESRRTYVRDLSGKYKIFFEEDPQVKVEIGMIWTNAINPCTDQEGPIPDMILITVRNCKQNPRVVQFIRREEKFLSGELKTGTYPKSSAACGDPPLQLSLNAWHTDGTPYYTGGYRKLCPPPTDESLAVSDAPNFTTWDPSRHEYMQATFVSFVLCNGEVVRQVRWIRRRDNSGEHYTVDPNLVVNPEEVKMLQRVSIQEGFTQPWAPCSMR